MSNKEIARQFQYLADIMELHGDNPFKIRSYRNAYITLRKLQQPLSEMSESEIGALKGIGKAIVGKIRELTDSGEMQTLTQWQEKTPPGIQEMLRIKGFGPKKIRAIWEGLGVETVGELLYATNENRLVELKGFGEKTQAELRRQLEYYQTTKNQFHYATLERAVRPLLAQIWQRLPDARVELTGALRRACPTLVEIELIIGYAYDLRALFDGVLLEPLTEASATALDQVPTVADNEKIIRVRTGDNLPVTIYHCHPANFGSRQFRHTGSDAFIAAFVAVFPEVDFKNLDSESAVFERAGLSYIPPELRESDWAIERAQTGNLPKLIQPEDIRGVVHAHTTYSDGLHTLRDMAGHARELGYGYLGITDHSKAAFYANGLSPERVREQIAEIDQLNAEYTDFRILKGIECDILADGSLDYDDDTLSLFDFVIVSVHSNLRMDENKATQRLLRAIDHPYTSMLGHPTGRLLLSRPGYPIDHQRVIDACAEAGVSIELNANPYRLDLDWTWLPYAIERGVLISINPDAHSTGGMDDIRYGVAAARKGGLTKSNCINALEADDFLKRLRK